MSEVAGLSRTGSPSPASAWPACFVPERGPSLRAGPGSPSEPSGISLPLPHARASGLTVAGESLRLPLGKLAESGPGLYPLILGLLLAGLSTLLLAQAWRGERAPLMARLGRPGKLLQILAACLFLLLALERLGFRLTMMVFLGFLLGWVERRPPGVAAALAVCLPWVTFYLFNDLLRVRLTAGPWGF